MTLLVSIERNKVKAGGGGVNRANVEKSMRSRWKR